MRTAFALVLLLAGSAAAHAQAPAAPNPSFSLSNGGRQAINELYATPAGVDRWGQDRLAQNSLAPGQSFPVRLPADGNCIYDIRVVYADGKPEEKRRVNTCQADSVVFPGGRIVTGQGSAPSNGGNPAPSGNGRTQATDDPSFRLLNRGRSAVNEVYVSASGDDSWGQDRLGDDTMAVGGTRVIRMPQGQCQYDVRVVFANGEAVEKRRLNLCTITDLRVP